MTLSRRDRLSNIIIGLSLGWPYGPRFTVGIGNNCPVSPFKDQGRPTLDMLTEEGLEITARFLIRDRASTKRRNEENRRLAVVPR